MTKMTAKQILEKAMVSYDRRFAEAVDQVCDLARDFGGTDEEIEAMRDLQHRVFVQDREDYRAKLRAWLARSGESLN
jgi:hypothetical protein